MTFLLVHVYLYIWVRCRGLEAKPLHMRQAGWLEHPGVSGVPVTGIPQGIHRAWSSPKLKFSSDNLALHAILYLLAAWRWVTLEVRWLARVNAIYNIKKLFWMQTLMSRKIPILVEIIWDLLLFRWMWVFSKECNSFTVSIITTLGF